LQTDKVEIDNVVLKKEKHKANIKVNARSLLAEVEGESELSFREKAINTYQTVKVAIATRNQETIINQN